MKTGNHITHIPLLLSGLLLFFFHAAHGTSGISNILPAAFGRTPVLSNIEPQELVYSRGSGEVIITKTLTISDDDSWNLKSAAVSITSGYNASEDVLTFKKQNGISGSWNKTTGVMTLSGSASVSRYQTALRSITYKNTNKVNPAKDTRVVSFMVSDGSNNSNVVNRNIVILSPNATPVLSNIETSTLLYCPGSGTVHVTSTLDAIDPDNLNLASASIQIISEYNQNEDFLRFTDQHNIKGSWEDATGTLNLSGAATIANYQAALRSIVYENTNSNSPDAGYHEISFTISDGTDNSNTVARNIMVNPRVTAVLTGSTSICLDDVSAATLSIDLYGTSPWTFTILRDDQDDESYRNITHNPFTFDVKKDGSYRIRSISDANCEGDTIGSGTAWVLPKPVPTAIISGVDTICQDETAELFIVLTGTAPWSISYLRNGAGQTTINNIETPNYTLMVKNTGTYTLVQVEDAVCKGKVSGTGMVRKYSSPTAVITGDTTICEYTAASLRITLTGNPPWRFSVQLNSATPFELQNIASSPEFILVNSAGTYTLIEVYDSHCKGSISGNAIVNVNPVPDVSLSGLAPAYDKKSTEWIPLTGTPSGGEFSGPGVLHYENGWYFIPALAPVGTNSIVYKYRTSPGTCYGFDTATVRIIEESAYIEFENNRTRYCRNDRPFMVTGTNLYGITGVFSITGGLGLYDNGNNTATVKPAELAANGYTISYTYFDGTYLQEQEDFEIGNSMVADFTWATECFHAGQPISLTDTINSTFGFFTDTSFIWKITSGNNSFTDTTRHTAHLFGEPGNYTIELSISNTYGCVDTVTKTFALRPTVELADTSYYEDFETNPISWQSGNDPTIPMNSWKLGNPSKHDEPLRGFSGAAGGTHCWYTSILTDLAPREQSWVSSPCFDFRGTESPMLKARIWRLFSDTRDGANFEASTDSGKSWLPVGGLNDGINWFNAYYGTAGKQSMGWTATKDAIWMQTTRHSLDAFKGQPQVQFRFSYGSIGTAYENDGLAFDDVWIVERNRTALMEHFTNSSDLSCFSADSTLEEFMLGYQQNAIDLQYHTSNPANDPFYEDNEVIPTTRQRYYGLSDVPYAVLDGGTKNPHRFDYIHDSRPFDPNQAIIESLIDSKFDIRMHNHISSNTLVTEVEIFNLQEIPLTELSVRIAVIERVVEGITGNNGDTLFRSVVKAMLPDAAGTTFPKAWGPGESIRIKETWELSNVYDPDELRVVIFVQDESTREVYQAAIDTIGIATGIDHHLPGSVKTSYVVYPNPAERQAFIRFDQETEEDLTVQMFNNTGGLVYTTRVPEGTSITEISLEEFPDGLYQLRLMTNQKLLGISKVVVSR